MLTVRRLARAHRMMSRVTASWVPWSPPMTKGGATVSAEPDADSAPDLNSFALDPWQLHGLPGGLALATYLTAPQASQYRLIVDVLLDEQQSSLTGVGIDELDVLVRARVTATAGVHVAARLLETFTLVSRMEALEAWDVVTRWDDRTGSAEYTSWNRSSQRYQLQPLAAELHRAVRRLGEDSAGSVAATFAPGVLRSQLETMRAQLRVDPEAVVKAWSIVQTTLDGMVRAAADWQSRLAGALVGPAADAKVSSLAQILNRYVDMWGAGVDNHSGALSDAAVELLAAPDEHWRAAAVYSAESGAGEERLVELVRTYHVTLRTVQTWFGGSDNQARQLRRQMRDAIAPMIRGQRTLAAVGGHVSRRAELLALAGALEASPDEATAWQTWCAVTGLFSARHLPLSSPQPGGAAGGTSFWDADPAPVEARLREQGTRALTGRPARISDRSAGRAAARHAAAAEREVAAATRKAMLDRSGTYLSTWTGLDHRQLDLLLMMLADLASAGADASVERRADTGDGLWHLRAEPPAPERPSAVLHSPDGRLVVADIRLTITASGLARGHSADGARMAGAHPSGRGT